MYREAYLHEPEQSFLASSTDNAAPNVPETWTDAEGLPVPQPHGQFETEHEAEGYSVAVVDNVSDHAIPMKAASAGGAVIGDFPWGCYWLPQGVLGTALWVLADSASVTVIHQGPVAAMTLDWLRKRAV